MCTTRSLRGTSGASSTWRKLWLLLFLWLPSLPHVSARSPWNAIKTRRGWWGRHPTISSRGGGSQEETFASSAAATAQVTIPNTAATNHTAANATTILPEWKQQFPEPLRSKKKTFQRICIPYQNQVAEIYLLGTAHVSNDSSADVKLLLQSLQPNVIFVELCEQRTSLMEDPPAILEETLLNHTTSFWEKVKTIQLETNNSKFQCMATVLLTQTQEEYADSLGVELGGEFKVAYRYWQSLRGTSQRRPHLILGDRPLSITLARCWESLSWFAKIKVVIGLLVSSIFFKPTPEELREWIQKVLANDETDLLQASMEDLRKHFPALERVIIQERDAYMACKLYQLCRGMLVQQQQQQHDNNNNNNITIAALVGAGHVPGICEWLTTKTNPQGPEEILAQLIATKKFQHEDLSALVYDVTELQDVVVQQQQQDTVKR